MSRNFKFINIKFYWNQVTKEKEPFLPGLNIHIRTRIRILLCKVEASWLSS